METPAATLPAPLARSRFCLPAAIADFITARDNIWQRVKVQFDQFGAPNLRDVGLLKVANDGARQMVSLTPGPTTPVLDPLRARVEQLSCDCCALFIARLDDEVPAVRPILHPDRPSAPEMVAAAFSSQTA